MAMTAVRLAARRLAVQQPQAILNRGCSPGANALRRFTSSEASSSSSSCCQRTKNQQRDLEIDNLSLLHIGQRPSASGDSHLMAADQKKYELFDRLHEIQMNKDIPLARRMKDRWILRRLTEHVGPRPSNPEWHWYHQEYAVSQFLRGTTVFFFYLYMFEKWAELGEFLHRGRVKEVDSDKASVEE